MAYGDFKDSAGKTGLDKVLRDKASSIAENSKYDIYQRGLASMVYILKESPLVVVFNLCQINN